MLTIKEAQERQPWTVPYAKGTIAAEISGLVPHILATHCALHAAKSVGKLAAVFEQLDHEGAEPGPGQLQTIKAISADLLIAALRFANLYKFDLAEELNKRVYEKNGVWLISPDVVIEQGTVGDKIA